MTSLAPMAEAIGALLKARGETVAVSESSTGGLIAAALLAVPGASAYFVGGGVVYTHKAREALLGVRLADHPGVRASTEPYTLLCATAICERCGTTWGLGETGAAGPDGSRYGDAPATAASPWPVRGRASLPWRPAGPNARPTCGALRGRRWRCSRRPFAAARAQAGAGAHAQLSLYGAPGRHLRVEAAGHGKRQPLGHRDMFDVCSMLS